MESTSQLAEFNLPVPQLCWGMNMEITAILLRRNAEEALYKTEVSQICS